MVRFMEGEWDEKCIKGGEVIFRERGARAKGAHGIVMGGEREGEEGGALLLSKRLDGIEMKLIEKVRKE